MQTQLWELCQVVREDADAPVHISQVLNEWLNQNQTRLKLRSPRRAVPPLPTEAHFPAASTMV